MNFIKNITLYKISDLNKYKIAYIINYLRLRL